MTTKSSADKCPVCCALLLTALLAGWAVARPTAALADEQEHPDYKAEFLRLCDLAIVELNKDSYTGFLESHRNTEDPKTHHYPFFEDAYGIRALCVAYDVTGRREYLDACTRWADRIVDYQGEMIPKGAYFLNYGPDARQPGVEKGDWWVADSGSIAMAVLATAVRTKDPQRRERYLGSLRSFARLVIDNYVRKSGGITDGIWSYSDEYWCSTYTFGAFMFLAYTEMKDPEYLQVGLNAVDWVNRHDFHQDKQPEFAAFCPCMVFYGYEFYAAALPHLQAGSARRQVTESHIAEGFQWLAENQAGRGAKSKWDYLGADTYMPGNPYFMYVMARQLPQYKDQAAEADRELRYAAQLLYRDGKPPRTTRLQTWEAMTFAMMSFAEKVSPGSLFRASRP